jgi:hypothetical protein
MSAFEPTQPCGGRACDDRLKPVSEPADGAADPYFRLDEAVRAALAAAVKKENDRPRSRPRVICGDEDLVPIAVVANGERAIQETGLGGLAER